MDAPAQIFLLSLCAQAAGAGLLAGVLFRLSRHFPRAYLPWWSAAWAAAAVAHAAAAASWTFSIRGFPPNGAGRIGVAVVSTLAGLSHALCMVQGALFLARGWGLPRRAIVAVSVAIVALTCAAAAASTMPGTTGAGRFLLRYGPRLIAVTVAYLTVAAILLQASRPVVQSGIGHRMVGWAFLLLGIHQQIYMVFAAPQPVADALRGVLPYAGFVDLVLQWIVGIGLVGWLLAEERGRAVEALEKARVTSQALEASLFARQELEGQLRQAQKMEAIGQLAGGIAHDFNNMLTAILGHAELLDHELARNDPRRADLEQIVRGARQAEALTRQLLTFARREPRTTVVLNVNQVVGSMERMLRRVLGEHISLIVTTGHDVPPVLADPVQMEQILLNLALNARDAMASGGCLRITTGLETFRNGTRAVGAALGPPNRRCARIVVEDTGIGIPEEHLPRIFEPFFTTKAPGRGTGLGLAMVYAAVTEAGGDIRVTSRVGQGTRVEIYLPESELDLAAGA